MMQNMEEAMRESVGRAIEKEALNEKDGPDLERLRWLGDTFGNFISPSTRELLDKFSDIINKSSSESIEELNNADIIDVHTPLTNIVDNIPYETLHSILCDIQNNGGSEITNIPGPVKPGFMNEGNLTADYQNNESRIKKPDQVNRIEILDIVRNEFSQKGKFFCNPLFVKKYGLSLPEGSNYQTETEDSVDYSQEGVGQTNLWNTAPYVGYRWDCDDGQWQAIALSMTYGNAVYVLDSRRMNNLSWSNFKELQPSRREMQAMGGKQLRNTQDAGGMAMRAMDHLTSPLDDSSPENAA